MNLSASMRSYDRLKKMRQAIKIKQSQIGIAEDAYRALLQRVAGVKSSTDIMSWDKADAVLNELNRLGAAKTPKVKPGCPGTPTTLNREPYLQKIGALLADMELPWAYAEAIAVNITGGVKPTSIKRLEWVREAKHLTGIIAALHNEKAKRVAKAREALGILLAQRGLTPEWAKEQAEVMDRLIRPWPWYECLETLRLITAKAKEH